jgi:hypothetical protein
MEQMAKPTCRDQNLLSRFFISAKGKIPVEIGKKRLPIVTSFT